MENNKLQTSKEEKTDENTTVSKKSDGGVQDKTGSSKAAQLKKDITLTLQKVPLKSIYIIYTYIVVMFVCCEYTWDML